MTPLRPAYETILVHGDHAVTLRASLRAAVNIDNMDGGLPAVLERLGQSHLSTIRAIIRASAPDRHQAELLLSSLDGHPLRRFMDEATPACLELIAHVLPTPDAQAKPSSTTSTEAAGQPWANHFTSLYQFATGWLGWTPDTTWNASADEITAAFTSHVDRLVAVNAGKSGDDQNAPVSPANIYTADRMAEVEERGFDPAFQRDKLHALKSRMG